MLSIGVEGKRLLWLALGELADPRLARFDFAALTQRAEQRRRGDQAPEQHVQNLNRELRHAVFSTVSAVAAEIMLTCVKACGKLPIASPVSGTISSA